MQAFFDAITKVDRWLRQRYARSGKPPPRRIFWNQIMVTIGIIMLKQQNLSVTQGNLERYTPIPSSSIYRTLALLNEYDVIKETDDDAYDFHGNIPRDILELSTDRKVTIDGIETLFNEFKTDMKTSLREALVGLNLEEEQINEVTRTVDEVRPEKNLTAYDKMFGEGSFL